MILSSILASSVTANALRESLPSAPHGFIFHLTLGRMPETVEILFFTAPSPPAPLVPKHPGLQGPGSLCHLFRVPIFVSESHLPSCAQPVRITAPARLLRTLSGFPGPWAAWTLRNGWSQCVVWSHVQERGCSGRTRVDASSLALGHKEEHQNISGLGNLNSWWHQMRM